MKNEVRPIDANALAVKIREYMANYPHAKTRLAACRALLSMLGDEGQTPTILQPTCNNAAGPCKGGGKQRDEARQDCAVAERNHMIEVERRKAAEARESKARKRG